MTAVSIPVPGGRLLEEHGCIHCVTQYVGLRGAAGVLQQRVVEAHSDVAVASGADLPMLL